MNWSEDKIIIVWSKNIYQNNIVFFYCEDTIAIPITKFTIGCRFYKITRTYLVYDFY